MTRTHKFKILRAARGFTLVETMIALLVIMVGFWAFYEVVVRTSDANDYAMAFTSLAATTQVAVNDIREDASVAKLLFRNDTIGQGYLAAVSLPTQFPMLGNSRLPGAREGGVFERDTSTTNYTGNVLLFAHMEQAYVGSLRYCINISKLRAVRVDQYRIVVYYLSKVQGASIGGAANSLNLVKATSPVYADYTEVNSILDPVTGEAPDLKAEALKDLYNNYGIRYLWNSTASAPSAFYALTTGAGGVVQIAAAPNATYRPPLSAPTEYIRNLRYKHASVAWNSGASFHIPVAVPAYGLASTSGDGFPHGFEVQVIGLSGARQTLVCITLARQIPAQRLASHRAQIVISSKDYF